jgi:hypothetical protein
MSAISSSSNIEVESLKRKVSDTDLDQQQDNVINCAASSSSGAELRIRARSDTPGEEVPTNLNDDYEPSIVTEETPIVTHDATSDDAETAPSEGTASGTTDEGAKADNSVIQIDFFEDTSETASISIQFLSSRSSLYGVVEALFEFFLEDRLQEAIYSHVWIIKMGRSSSYIGPFPESAFDGSQVRLHNSLLTNMMRPLLKYLDERL